MGSLSIRSYADEATPLHHDDCYLIQIVSYHPGALSYGVSQQPMQRVFSMTMFKAWLTASEALKYSDSTLSGRLICEQIVSSVERWLDQETNFYAQFKMAKDEIDQINDETRWKSPAERLASQLLRKNVAVQKTIANNRRGKVPVTSRPVRVTDLQKQVTASRPVSIVLKEHMLPESYFAGRQHLFKMTYRNGTVAASAVQMAREGLPLQRGDFLWLLDQFIRDIFPFGGSLICADPAVLPDVDSIWPKLGTFCSQSRFSRHPYAKYLGAMAREGGTSAITALNEALKILRESVHKQRLRKYLKEQQKQVRYTAFEIEASIPDNLRAKE